MADATLSIGVDVGGTHTDAALVDGAGHVHRCAKVATTVDVLGGLARAVHALAPPAACEGVFVGSTQALNALLSNAGLAKVGVLRLASHAPEGLRPGCGWPPALRRSVLVGHATVAGGHQRDGRPLGALRPAELRAAADVLVRAGAQALVVVGTFAPLHPAHERAAAAVLAHAFVGREVVLSHEVSADLLLERENAAVLEAALRPVLRAQFGALRAALRDAGCAAPVWMGQNAGHAVPLEQALARPLHTLLAGPTNSLNGAAALTRLADAVVADVGGTSTDVGRLRGGRPVHRARPIDVAGVRVGLVAPYLLTRALGGGSVVHGGASGELRLGPESIGARLGEEALSFGGGVSTLTDAAVALGVVEFGRGLRPRMPVRVAERVMRLACAEIARLHARVAGRAHLPLVLVGGGAALLPRQYLPHHTVRPPLGAVANAIGAARAEVQAVCRLAVTLPLRPKQAAAARREALAQAERAGACAPRVVEERLASPAYGGGQGIATLVVVAAGPRRGLHRSARSMASKTHDSGDPR